MLGYRVRGQDGLPALEYGVGEAREEGRTTGGGEGEKFQKMLQNIHENTIIHMQPFPSMPGANLTRV